MPDEKDYVSTSISADKAIDLLLFSIEQAEYEGTSSYRAMTMIDTLGDDWRENVQHILECGQSVGWFKDFSIFKYGEEIDEGFSWEADHFALKGIDLERVYDALGAYYDKAYLVPTEIAGVAKQKFVMSNALLAKRERTGLTEFIFTNGNFKEFCAANISSVSFYSSLKGIEADGQLEILQISTQQFSYHGQPDFYKITIKLLSALLNGTNPYAAIQLSNPTTSARRMRPEPLFPVSSDVKWENIEIKLLEGNEAEIYIKRRYYKTTDYYEMGFCRKRTKGCLPDIQWELLQRLSICSGRQDFIPTAEELARTFVTDSKKPRFVAGSLQKVKSKLAMRLQDIFGISDDPFHKYDAQIGYRIRFVLAPIPVLRGDGEAYLIASGYNDSWAQSSEKLES